MQRDVHLDEALTAPTSSGRLRLVLAALVGLLLAVPRAGGAAACHSTCAQQLIECKRACPGGGQARRECRATCAERSACAAPGARIRTLAYVVTECSDSLLGAGASSIGQKLVVRRGNCDPVTVLEFPMRPLGPDPYSRCQGYGSFRVGEQTVDVGVFQRSAVLPDGSGVVFEVTNDFSLFPALTPEPPEKGMFFVHADGAGLRRLGPASRIPTFYAIGRVVYNIPELFFAVSPDGRTIAFSDLGTGSDRQETAQIFTLDIATGRRRKQVTHLRLPAKPTRLSCIAFLDNRTLTFCKRVDSGDGNGVIISGVFTVRTDGSRFEEVPVVALPGGGIVPVFTVEGSGSRAAVTVVFHEPARNHFFMLFIDPFIEELFLLQGKTVLQLTNFGRSDTTRAQGGVVAGQRVFFHASANPFGTNPGENCQVFSINTDGGDLRQLTRLRDDKRPTTGCFLNGEDRACTIVRVWVDRLTGAVGFASTCDPLGRNPFGYQAFSMRPDGSGLRQLTSTRGRETDPDGTLHVELPGPIYFR